MANESGEKGKMGCAIAVVAVLLPVLLAVIMLIVNNKPPNVVIPTHSVPKDNGLDYFLRAGHMLGTPGPISSTKDLNKWTDADYEAFMKSNAPALAELRRGLMKPCVCPPQRGLKDMGNPAYSTDRELARTLRSEAMYYERRGEYGRAVDSQLDCIEMGVGLPRGGALICDLVGDAIVAIGSSKIEANLARLNPSELARAAARVERIQKKMVPYSEIMLEEGYMLASEYADIFAEPDIRSTMINPLKWTELSGQFTASSGGSAPVDFVQGARLAFANKTAFVGQMLDYYKAVAVESRKAYTGTSSVPIPQGPLQDMIPDVATRGRAAHLRAETIITLIQTELALRRFNADQKHYPARLDDLVPGYLKAVPIDPFGVGKPLRYKPINGGKSFMLYSVSTNMTDDGGKSSARRGDWTEGDALLQNQ